MTRIPYRPDETFEVNDRVRYEFPGGTRWEGVVEEVTADRTDSNYPMYSIRKDSGETALLAAGYLTKIGMEEVTSYSPGDKVKVAASTNRLAEQSIPTVAASRLRDAEYVVVRRAGGNYVEVDDPAETREPNELETWYMAPRDVVPYTEGDPSSSTDRGTTRRAPLEGPGIAFRVGDVVEHKSWGWRGEVTGIDGTWCDVRITGDASESSAVVGSERTALGENLRLIQEAANDTPPSITYPSDFHEWKLSVATEALRLADEYDMCSTVEDFLKTHDFPIPKSTTTLRVEIVLESADRIDLKSAVDEITLKADSLKREHPEVQSVVIDEDD